MPRGRRGRRFGAGRRSGKSRRPLGELAHIGRLYVGRCVPKDKDSCARIVGVKDARKLAERVARSMGGGATVFTARGIWKEPRRAGTREPTMVVETVTSGATSCERVRRRLHGAAASVARQAQQSAVLVTVQCADGRTDAELISQSGAPFMPLLRLGRYQRRRR